jgi:hypothetical protein
MRIELRTAPGCPNAEPARTVVANCLTALGIDVPLIELVGHYPSPTILIDGVDVMRPNSGPADGDACRLDMPTRQRVLAALQGARVEQPQER